MLAHWRARGYVIEETRQGRTQKLRAHYAKGLSWNQEGPVPFPGRYPQFRGFPDRIGPLWGPPSGARACASGSADRLPRTGKRRGPGQSVGAAAVSPHLLIGAKVFIKNEMLQRINVTLFQRVTVIALHVITLETWNCFSVSASWRDNALTFHCSTVLPLHGMTLMRL
jgi:hypothetical protein